MRILGISFGELKKRHLDMIAKVPQLRLQGLTETARKKIIKDIEFLKRDVTKYMDKNILPAGEVDQLSEILKWCYAILERPR